MKKIISLLLLFTMIFLCACTSKKDEISLNKNAQQENNESIQKSLQINIDVISDIGLSYSQISAKRGKLTNAGYTGGAGAFFEFENGFGRYTFPHEFLSWKTDESGNAILSTVIPPSDDIPCFWQEYIKIEDLFPGISLPANLYDIAKIPHVGFIDVAEDNTETVNGRYNSIFCYDKYIVYIATTEKGIIDKDSYADIYYGPLFNYKIYGDLSSTYSQIEKEKGPLTEAYIEDNSIFYRFENGMGDYKWVISSEILSAIEKDENGNIPLASVVTPPEDDFCCQIKNIKISDLLLGFPLPNSVYSISKSFKVKELLVSDEKISFNMDGIKTTIYTPEKNKLTEDSLAEISRPRYR